MNTDYAYSDVNLKIEGVDGGSANISFSCDPTTGAFASASNRVFPLNVNNANDETVTYIVILDDVTTGLTFATLPFDAPVELGSDIKLTVEAEGQQVTKDDDGQAVVNPTILTGKSNTVTRNSLFSEGSSPTDAKIKNFRHLQNLSELSPGSSTAVAATLEQNLCWSSPDPDDKTTFTETVKAIHDSYSNGLPAPSYTPVKTAYNMTFEGGNHTISNLDIGKTNGDNAGVFGTLNGATTIQNLTLDGTTVSASGAKAAGALVGDSTGNLTVNNVSSSSGGSIQAKNYAGGLIGHAAGTLTVTNARAQISSGGSVAATDANGEAGGLIGGASGTISVHDAETSSNGSITAANYAGGLMGQGNGIVDVENARAHISSGGSVAATGASGVAGGLMGGASGDVSVKYSASYSKDAATGGGDGAPGIVKATGGNGVAGGLIGSVQGTGGGAKIEGCAAANKVTASNENGVAGGMIGKTSGNVGVSTSYAGGMTKDGKYEKTASGALNGNVQGAYAGGLIGQAASGTTLKDAYSTASASGSKAAGNLYTETAPNSVTKQGTVYGAGQYQTGGGAIQPGDDPPFEEHPATGGKPYDKELLNNAGSATSYPYTSVKDKGASGGYDWTDNHVGDWPVIPLQPQITLHNDEVLYAEVKLDDLKYKDVQLKLTGPNGTSAAIPFTLDSDGNIQQSQRVYPKKDADGNIISYIVILDDVTVDNLGFGDIAGNNIPLGSDITATIDATSKGGRTGTAWDKCNSLFAGDRDDPPNYSSPTDAKIENFRHLQNLRKLNPESGTTVKGMRKIIVGRPHLKT